VIAVRFLKSAHVGYRFYSPGVLAAVPDKSVPDLVARGIAELQRSPGTAPITEGAVAARVTKPSPVGMSKAALKRLLRGRA